MSSLIELTAHAWSTEDRAILCDILRMHASEGGDTVFQFAGLMLLGRPVDLAVGRAMLWLPGRSSQRRDLLRHCLSVAAVTVGPLDVARVSEPSEFWAPPTPCLPQQAQALALLAEAAARGVKLPPLELRDDAEPRTCWRVEVGTDRLWVSALGRALRGMVTD